MTEAPFSMVWNAKTRVFTLEFAHPAFATPIEVGLPAEIAAMMAIDILEACQGNPGAGVEI